MLSRLFTRSGKTKMGVDNGEHEPLLGGDGDDLRERIDFHTSHLRFESTDTIDENFLHLALQVSMLEANVDKLKKALEMELFTFLTFMLSQSFMESLSQY